MKNRLSQFPLIVMFVAITLLLSACQINFMTEIKNDGAGSYTQEIGFQGDEASMAGLTEGDESFCTSQNSELPPGTTIRQETRNENETWCIYETAFNSLENLRAIYGSTDMLTNDISLVDGTLTYDITLDLSGDSSSAPAGADIFWNVSMPGKIVENNATDQDGNNLKWKLALGQANNIRAVSNVGGLNTGSNTTWYIVGAASLCLCGLVVLVIGGVVIFLVLRKKKVAAEANAPVEAPTA